MVSDWRLQTYDSLGSTSDLGIELAKAGEPEGLAILALHQTSARGTRRRGWSSPAGNLALSVLLRPTEADGQWSLLAGLAVIEALSGFVPVPTRLQLKWPNDINLDGRKLAGILIDSEAGPAPWLVIGIGANLAQAPTIPDRATACLAQAGANPAPEAAATAILGRLTHWRAMLDRDGFGPIRAAWMARAHPIGTPLLVSAGHSHIQGVFNGLAPSGALCLLAEDGPHQFTSAEVQSIPLRGTCHGLRHPAAPIP